MSEFLTSVRAARLRLWRLNRRLVQPKLAQLRSDPLIRQARQLERAYAGPNGPKVLIFGDSVMLWTTPFDTDRRSLATMIDHAVGPEMTTLAISGPAYNSRIIRSLLTAIDNGRSQPEVVIVPASVNTSTDALLFHFRTSYAHQAASLRSVITRRAWSTRRLATMPEDEVDRYDRQPAPSWFGAQRTYGELDLIMHAKSTRRWQATIRMQNVLDYNTAQRLEPDGPGPVLIAEMSAELRRRGLPTVAYIGPMNYGALESAGVPQAREHLRHNASVVAQAFTSEAGPFSALVDASLDFAESEFGDHLHIKDNGRILLAQRIADAVRELHDKAHASDRP